MTPENPLPIPRHGLAERVLACDHRGVSTDIVCASCGAVPADESAIERARVTWALGHERGRSVWTCDQCQRRFLRGIEGKLDSDWW